MRAVTAEKAWRSGATLSRVLLAGATMLAAGAGTALAQEKSGLPQLNVQDYAPQLFWLAVTFGLLLFIMQRVALPRIGEVIEERKDRVQRDLAAAERLKGETEKALAAYEKALAEARSSASGIARETREALNAEVEKDRHAAEGQLATKLAEAEATIGATKTKALASIKDVAADTAAAIVNQLTGLNPSKDEIASALAPVSKK